MKVKRTVRIKVDVYRNEAGEYMVNEREVLKGTDTKPKEFEGYEHLGSVAGGTKTKEYKVALVEDAEE